MTGRAPPFKCSAVISGVDGTLVTDYKILTREQRLPWRRCEQTEHDKIDLSRRSYWTNLTLDARV